MGTSYTIKFHGSAANQIDLKQDIDTLLDTINLKMSTYITSSEISRFNNLDSTGWLPLSKETLEVILKSIEVHQKSGGALDITVGPLVNLWGFGPEKRPSKVPDQPAINIAMQHSGVELLKTDEHQLQIRKLHPQVELDLSAIAKGYAVDQVALLFKQRGLTNFLIEIGGELRAQGRKKNGQPWIVAVERADNTSRQAQQLLELNDLSLATSGSYRNYFEEGGIRYSHTIDPNTGYPIRHTLVSVSVAAKDCMTADAWATALMVLGPSTGLATAESQNIAALFIVKKASSFIENRSSKWNSLLP